MIRLCIDSPEFRILESSGLSLSLLATTALRGSDFASVSGAWIPSLYVAGSSGGYDCFLGTVGGRLETTIIMAQSMAVTGPCGHCSAVFVAVILQR